ncbi:MAG: oligosaccharide flippase family protein, partial [Candidatus Binataceae bacterium]
MTAPSGADDRAQLQPSLAELRQSLWSAFARSVRDNMVAEVAVQVLRVGGMVVLARALRPEDFGLLKVLVVVSVFATLLCEGGIPDATIQRKQLSREHEVTAWWLNLALTAVTITGLYLLAPFIAVAMEMPALTFGIRLMCIPLALEGTAISANARLRRELRFGALALADVVGEVAFLAAAFILLWLNYPELSLAGGLAARLAFHALTVWIADPRVPLGTPRIAAACDLGRFSLSVCGGRVITSASGNADYILVGRLLGSGALGFYSIAWDLLRFVPDRLHKVAGRVAFPAFSRLQDDDDEFARAYGNFVNYVARVVLPIAACAAIAAPELLGSIYGVKWIPAAWPMRLLAGGLALAGLRTGIGSVYYAKNYPSFDIYLNGMRLGLIVAAVIACADAGMGLFGVSASVSAVEAVISIAGEYLACMLVGMRMRDFWRATLPGVRTAVFCAVATAAGKIVAQLLGIDAPTVLVFVAAPPAAAFLWLEAREVI